MYSGKHALLPPKSPFPSLSPSYVDFVPSSVIGSKAVQKPREGNTLHQRTSSETLIEEQPSWLDDLLNEPETPVRRGGHRRSSSDSYAYIDVANMSNIDHTVQGEYTYKNAMSIPSWGYQEFDYHKDVQQNALYAEMNMTKQKNRAWDSSMNAPSYPSGLSSARENAVLQSSGSSSAAQEADGVSGSEKQDQQETGPHDLKNLSEKKDGSHAKSSASDTDTKRAKQYVLYLLLFNIQYTILTYIGIWAWLKPQ